MEYQEMSEIFKILSNAKRVEILDLLARGELCACELQKQFNVTQPTLSYDMKLLKDSSLIKEKIVGRSHYYSLNEEIIDELSQVFLKLSNTKKTSSCNKQN
eukprot:Anaeramoba_ignava/a612767_28.p3 GENE.a612767_28~~a612767_28.p3  ORF type:complete len:101 (-),score=18.28 a612767_28:1277-1579(-)